MRDAGWADVVVARAPNRLMAEMWAELLGEHGIACRLVPVSAADNVYVPSQGEVEVRVRGIDAPRAQELLPHDGQRHHDEPAAEAEEAPSSDPVERRLRWAVVAGVVLLVVLIVALAVRLSAARGYL
jgi:hypothetical protein